MLVQGIIALRSPQERAPRAKRTRPTSTRPSLQTQLQQAELAIAPGQYRASVIGAAVATFLVVYALTSIVSVSLTPAVAVALAPRAYYRNRRDKILHDRVAAWPEAVRDVLTHLAVDRTVHQALVELGAPALNLCGLRGRPTLATPLCSTLQRRSPRSVLTSPIRYRIT